MEDRCGRSFYIFLYGVYLNAEQMWMKMYRQLENVYSNIDEAFRDYGWWVLE